MSLDSGTFETLRSRWQYGRLTPMPEREPDGWTLVKLSAVAQLESGHTPSRRHPEYWAGAIPWVSLHDSKRLDQSELHETVQTIGELGLANSSARILPAGTVIFSRTATVGKSTILAREMATSQDFANYICGPRVHNRYLMQLLRFLQPEWSRLMAGSTHNTIYMPVFENLQVLLPPLGEQQQIAAILSAADNTIEATQAVIDQLRAVKKAMMSELLTRGLPGRHTRFRQTDIGEVPEDWEVTTLGAICSDDGLQTGPFGSQLKASEYEETGVPVVMPRDIVEQRITTTSIERISESRAASLPQHRLARGDVVFGRRGDIGRCALVRAAEAGWICGTGCLRARPRPDISPEFLIQWLGFGPVTAWLTSRAVGQTMLNLNTEILGLTPVALPARDEQERIAAAITSVEERLVAERATAAAARSLQGALRSALLTGEVRVTTHELAE